MKGNEIEMSDFHEPTMIICINKTFEDKNCHPTVAEIYDATRWQWVVSIERADRCKLVLARYQSEIVEAYRVDHWDKARNMELPATRPEQVAEEKRKAFVGRVAEKEVRDRFVGKSVRQLLSDNPRKEIRYFGE